MTALVAWKLLVALLVTPWGMLVTRAVIRRLGSPEKQRVSDLDLAEKMHATDLARMRAEIDRHHHIRDAELLAAVTEVVKLREKNTALEVKLAWARGQAQRIGEEREEERARADLRKDKT